MANKIDDLRKHLFETLDALKDKDHPMELDRARAVADVAKVIVESAKVEVDFMKVTGAMQGTGFLPDAEVQPKAPRPRLAERNDNAPAAAIPAGEQCVLCRCRLTTPYTIERGLCGSCADRPEGRQALQARKLA